MNIMRRLAHQYKEMEENPSPLCYAKPEDPKKHMTH